MTETFLRTRTHAAGYGASGLCFLLVALQSLRFGFYELFFSALLIVLVLVGGILYTVAMRHQQLKAPGHQYLLYAISLIALFTAITTAEYALLWLFPLMLLNLLILPLRRGLICCGAVIGVAVLMLWVRWDYALLATVVGLLLVTTTAALFAYRYHYNARSVDTLTLVDADTGAYNLRCLEDTLGREISRSEVTGHPLSMACLQVDFFDELLRMHGRPALLPAMRGISNLLRQTLRAGDSHYYADDGCFYLLLPYTGEEGVRVISERVRQVIADGHWPAAESLTISLGSTTRGDGESDAEALRSRCRQALRQARERGHNRIWHLSHPAREPRRAS